MIGGSHVTLRPDEALDGAFDAVCLGEGKAALIELAAALERGVRSSGIADFWLRRGADVERARVPPGFAGRPFFGISYFSSFSCPEPCGFCRSPEISGMRWKSMPAERLLDDLCGRHERWGFDTVRFYDANFGANEKRLDAFAHGLLERGRRMWWYPPMESSSVARYRPETLDALRDSGMYVVQLGAESGDAAMLDQIGKHRNASDNFEAALAMERRDICTWMTYIIGFPDEDEAAMLSTLEEARRICSACRLARANVWPFRPMPGTAMYARALALGSQPPSTLEGRASDEIYHLRSPWPGQAPVTLAQRRIASGDFRFGLFEARSFALFERIRRALSPGAAERERARARGFQTAVLAQRERT